MTEGGAIHLIVSHKSAEGKVGHVVGEAVEASTSRKAEQQKSTPILAKKRHKVVPTHFPLVKGWFVVSYRSSFSDPRKAAFSRSF